MVSREEIGRGGGGAEVDDGEALGEGGGEGKKCVVQS